MSGGSMDYVCYRLEEYAPMMGDAEIINLMKDLSTLCHDREWYLSGDYGEGSWNESLLNFKKKWFQQPRRDRLKKLIDEELLNVKNQLYQMVGISKYCKDCKNFKQIKDGYSYGDCIHIKGCSQHKFDSVCEKFEEIE